MDLNPISSVANGVVKPVADLIDNLFTSDEEREAGKLALASERGRQALAQFTAALGPMLAEAQSQDPWTSRARPTFLYVMYLMILWSIPMGVLYAFKPDVAEAVAKGVQLWLEATPAELYTLFCVGYLGYTGFRSWDKKKPKQR